MTPLRWLLAAILLLACALGLLAELQARTYHESQAKPTYSVRRVVNSPHETE